LLQFMRLQRTASPGYHEAMSPITSRDFGHGVRVVPGDGDCLVVLSEAVDLSWRPRKEGRPGSAVMIEGESYEVVEHQPWRRGGRWILEPWTGEDVMRVIFSLDEASVADVVETARTSARAERLGPWMYAFAPLLGFAASSWQRRWRDSWGFPAFTATWTSAILELLVGGVCVVELLISGFAGESVFPWLPRPLTHVGLFFFLEGLVRLVQVFGDPEPVGTVFGLVASVFEASRQPEPESVPAPKVQIRDLDAGWLELLSPIQRRDWEESGLLHYQGETFALDGQNRQGESWLYVFVRVEVADDWNGRRLRLLPPRSTVEKRTFSGSPGLVKSVLLSIACTLAQGRFQERWGWLTGVRATWFTVLGAVAELFGGLSNLGSGAGVQPVGLALNLFFVFEGVTRIGWVVLRGESLGSVLGLPLTPLLEKLLPE